MFVLLLILIVVLFGLGFLNPLWWVAAAVLLFGATRYGRDRGEAGSVATTPISGTTGTTRSAGTVRTAGTAATAVRTGRAGGARTAGTVNAAGDR